MDEEITVEWLEANAKARDFNVDNATEYAFYREYTLADGRIYSRRLAGFGKINPYAQVGARPEDPAEGMIEVEIAGVRVDVPVETLDRKTGVEDTAGEFTCWVEHWAPGADAPCKRSVAMSLKTTLPAVTTTAGSVG